MLGSNPRPPANRAFEGVLNEPRIPIGSRDSDMFNPDPIQFEGFCWMHCRGKRLIELPIDTFHRELIKLIEYNKIAIAAPRHFSKSSYFAKFYPLFRALEDPGSQSMLLSSTSQLGEEHLSHVKALLENSHSLKEYYGDQVTKKWRIDEIELANGSKIFAKGSGKQIRGFHPDVVICDDMEDDELVANPDRLKKFEYWFWTDVVGVLPAHGQLIVIGTILHPESFLSNLINHHREGWETRFYQAIKQNGDSLWPALWPIDRLEKLKSEMGTYEFEQEFQNNPIPDDLRKFQRHWIKNFTSEPIGCSYFTAVDPAIETKNVNDFTAIVTIAVDSYDNIYVVNVINKRMLPSEIIDSIFDVFKLFKPQCIGIETEGYQKMLSIEFKRQREDRGLYPIVKELKSGGKRKQVRIEAMQPRFESGKIYIKESMTELTTQLLRFPSPRCKDDAIDALSYCIGLAKPSTESVARTNPESFEAAIQEIRNKSITPKIWGMHRVRRKFM